MTNQSDNMNRHPTAEISEDDDPIAQEQTPPKKTIYISGPMTGLPLFNFPAFNAEAAKFRALGYEVLNPAETDNGDTSQPWHYYIRKDVRMVCDSDIVVVLPGWRKSRGAQLEVMVADAMAIPVLDTDLKPVAETVLAEADRIVAHDRQNDYGHPYFDFSRTGRIWGALLCSWAEATGGKHPVPPELVALCMVGVKLSREVHKPKRDNRVDGAGYFKCADMCHDFRTKLEAAK